MNNQFKGTSPLAVLVDSMPVRSRVGIALLAADIALDQLRSSRHFPTAREAFELGRRWYDGEPFDLSRLDQFEDELHNASLVARDAVSEKELSAWLALGNAVAYTAFFAYRLAGEFPAPTICEVEEDVIDEVDKAGRMIAPEFMSTMQRAAQYLGQEPGASFAELRSQVLGFR